MSTNEDRPASPSQTVVISLPKAVAAAAQAQRELISLSAVCRRALVRDLENRGLLTPAA